MKILRRIFRTLWNWLRMAESFWWCLRNRLKFDPTWKIIGHLYVIRPPFYHPQPEIRIGRSFSAISRFTSNSFGLIQPVLLRGEIGAKLTIGENTGLSGCTICFSQEITIGDRVMIGTGSIITDNDAHPLLPEDRECAENTGKKSVHIGNDVFIGARSIILKGVTIGDGAVIGAGSVVTKDIPPRTLYAGNPAQFVRNL